MNEIREIHGDDIILWPDGTWAFRRDIQEHEFQGVYDFEVITVDSPRWLEMLDG